MLAIWAHQQIAASGLLSGTTFLAAEGATTPYYVATHPASIHVPSRNQTYFGFETNFGENRISRSVQYDHDTDTWDGAEAVFLSTVTDDDHGVPAAVVDYQGYVHWFGGSHNNASMRHSVEVSPGANRYTPNANITDINATYPHPHSYGNNLHVFVRHNTNVDRHVLYYKKTTALADGVPTWAAAAECINMGADSRVYQGNQVFDPADASLLWMVMVRSDLGDNYRRDVYLVGFDLDNGTMRNWAGDVTVVQASWPLDITTLNASFRLYAHSAGRSGQIAHIVFDENNRPVISFSDGDQATLVTNLYTLEWNGAAWVQSAIHHTYQDWHNNSCVVKTPTSIDLYFSHDGTATYTQGGHIERKRRIAGVWGAEEMIMEPERNYALDNPSPIPNAHANARLVFCERGPNDTAEVGTLRVYAYGDNGLLRRPVRTLWHPRDLGSKLSRWYAADNAKTGSSWADKINYIQITPVASPVAASNSFNAAYPGITFNGTTQCFETTSLGNIPTDGNAGEVWGVFDAVDTAAARNAVVYGGTTGAVRRLLGLTSADLPAISDGATQITDVAVQNDPAILRGQWSGTTEFGWINGVPFSPSPSAVIAALATGSTRMRIGASVSASPSNFFSGVFSDVFFVTGTLTVAEAQKLEGWIAHNRDLTAKLASDHPYKTTAPLV